MTDSDKERAEKMIAHLLKSGSTLQMFVYDSVIEDAENYDGDKVESILSRLDDIISNGCVSGTVGELCYYSQTRAVFKEHEEQIIEYVNAELYFQCSQNDGGFTIYDLIQGLDRTDPFMVGDNNINLIVWYVYESIALGMQDDILYNEPPCIEE